MYGLRQTFNKNETKKPNNNNLNNNGFTLFSKDIPLSTNF